MIRIVYIESGEEDTILQEELNTIAETCDVMSIHTRPNNMWVIIYDEMEIL